jgi:hypothetical protein
VYFFSPSPTGSLDIIFSCCYHPRVLHGASELALVVCMVELHGHDGVVLSILASLTRDMCISMSKEDFQAQGVCLLGGCCRFRLWDTLGRKVVIG